MGLKTIAKMLGLSALLTVGIVTTGGAQVIEDFSGTPAARWEFITDQVMGGVSAGQVTLEPVQGQTVLHLKGRVSTANNGGFIQARRRLTEPLPETAQGLELKIRGNSQTYYIHARTAGTVLPWTYYQAKIDVTPDWTILRVPFSAFRAEGRMLRKTLPAEAITSLALVAFGRDHEADVTLASITLY